ncbi:MAG: hypothetical protein HWD59_07980 [Coxiellaceae bacterium]|nr:MAG: hypothetical protein HWD59_07980 [Coxiellaceae bacterium]
MNNQIQSRSPLKQKMVMGVTYCFGIGQVLVAMVPLGVAAYVEFYRLEKMFLCPPQWGYRRILVNFCDCYV